MENVTTRDEVWSTVMDYILNRKRKWLGGGRFRVSTIIARSEELDESNRRTVRRVLTAMTELGWLDHEPGSPYWEEREDLETIFEERVEEIESRERGLEMLSSRL